MTTIVPANTVRIQPSPLLTPQCAPNHAPMLVVIDRSRPRAPINLSVQCKDAAGNAGHAHDNNDLHAVGQHQIQAAQSAQRHQYKNTGPNLK